MNNFVVEDQGRSSTDPLDRETLVRFVRHKLGRFRENIREHAECFVDKFLDKLRRSNASGGSRKLQRQGHQSTVLEACWEAVLHELCFLSRSESIEQYSSYKEPLVIFLQKELSDAQYGPDVQVLASELVDDFLHHAANWYEALPPAADRQIVDWLLEELKSDCWTLTGFLLRRTGGRPNDESKIWNRVCGVIDGVSQSIRPLAETSANNAGRVH